MIAFVAIVILFLLGLPLFASMIAVGRIERERIRRDRAARLPFDERLK